MLNGIDEAAFVASTLASNVQSMETTMQKTALTISGALLISGMAFQMAAASEYHHHLTKTNLSRHHYSDFRGAYNQMKAPINVTGSGFRRFDPSWIGDEDPALSPAN